MDRWVDGWPGVWRIEGDQIIDGGHMDKWVDR